MVNVRQVETTTQAKATPKRHTCFRSTSFRTVDLSSKHRLQSGSLNLKLKLNHTTRQPIHGHKKMKTLTMSMQGMTRSLFQLSRQDREFFSFSLVFRDENENFILSVLCFETRMKNYLFESRAGKNEVYSHKNFRE